jgi:hypothetical protein
LLKKLKLSKQSKVNAKRLAAATEAELMLSLLQLLLLKRKLLKLKLKKLLLQKENNRNWHNFRRRQCVKKIVST